MAQFVWSPGSPVGAGVPVCHGSPRQFDPQCRECRQCGFQNSCRDKIEQDRRAMAFSGQPIPVAINQGPAAFSPPMQQQSYYQQQPQQQQYWQQPQPFQPQNGMMRVGQPQQMQMAPQQQYMQQFSPYQEVYGRYQDPLYYVMAANPVPPRLQMPGESFWARVFKNVFLSVAESVTQEAFLAVRQMVLPPRPPQQPTAVDITPR